MAQPATQHHHETTRVEPRFTRRMLAKATAGFAAAAVFANTAPAAKPAIAQESGTRGTEWWAPEGAGRSTHANSSRESGSMRSRLRSAFDRRSCAMA